MAKRKDDFAKLQAKWYKKAKAAGFEDIEGSESYLKIYSTRLFHRHDRDAGKIQAKAEYYRLATHFLHDHKFESERDKLIWEYHSNGLSAKDISEILKKVKVSNIKRSAITNVITKLSDAMKRRYLVAGGNHDEH